jgi:ADP-heptose:LPS heptosyltransferase
VSTTERILVVKLGAFGDIVLADGALQDLRAHHATARITLLTRAPYAALMRACPWVDAVAIDDNAPRWRLPSMLGWRKRFLAGAYDRVYDLQNSRRTAFYRRWLSGGQPQRWSTSVRDPARLAEGVPARHARQLAEAGVTVHHATTPTPAWMATDAAPLLRAAGIAPSASPFVLLLPGSSARNSGKRWPDFAALSHALAAEGLGVVTVPGPDEADLGPGYAGCVLRDGDRAVDLCRLAGIARLAACVVGNDSGPLHLAASLGTPSVLLLDNDNVSFHAAGPRASLHRLGAIPLASLPLPAVVDAVRAAIRA